MRITGAPGKRPGEASRPQAAAKSAAAIIVPRSVQRRLIMSAPPARLSAHGVARITSAMRSTVGRPLFEVGEAECLTVENLPVLRHEHAGPRRIGAAVVLQDRVKLGGNRGRNGDRRAEEDRGRTQHILASWSCRRIGRILQPLLSMLILLKNGSGRNKLRAGR